MKDIRIKMKAPIYDTDGKPFEEHAFYDVQGSTTPPSEVTKKEFYSRQRDEKGKRKLPEDIPPLCLSEATLAGTDPISEILLREELYSEVEEFALGVSNTVRDYYGLNGMTLEDQIKKIKNYKKEIPPSLAFDILTVEGALKDFLPDEIYSIVTGKSRKKIFEIHEERGRLREKIKKELRHEKDSKKRKKLFKMLDSLPYKKNLSEIFEEGLMKIKLGEITYSE